MIVTSQPYQTHRPLDTTANEQRNKIAPAAGVGFGQDEFNREEQLRAAPDLFSRIEALEKSLQQENRKKSTQQYNLLELDLPYRRVNNYISVRDFENPQHLIDLVV